MMKKYGTILGLALILMSESAQANMALVGGIDYNMESYSASASAGSVTVTSSVKGGLGFGGGLLVGLGTLETGALIISKSFTTSTTGSAATTSSSSALQIPIMARLGSGAVSLGVGAFVDIGSGSNYGLSFGPRFGGGDKGGLFLDARYNLGLKSTNTKDILAMIGYAFGGKK